MLIIPRRQMLAGAGAALITRPALANMMLGGSGGGALPWVLKANTVSQTGAATSVTTSAIDTTGADLLIATIFSFTNDVSGAITDSKGNTWPGSPTAQGGAAGAYTKLRFVQGGTVGSGHTFTYTGSISTYGGILVAAFSGSLASPVDQQTSAFAAANTVQPGSITPTLNTELVVTSFCGNEMAVSGTATVNSGFALTDSVSGGGGTEGAMAWLQQTTAAAVNPTWTAGDSSSNPSSALIISFKHA